MKFDNPLNFSKIPTLRTVALLTPEAFNSYIDTLLWSETDEDGDRYDTYCVPSDIDETALEDQWNECYQFVKENAEAINELLEIGHELESILHDFCLTRNREGAGFWEDGDYPYEISQQLTTSAQKFPALSLYTGDDGGLYIFCG